MDLKLEEADLHVCGSASSFLQSPFWGAFKAEFGWKPKAFLVEADTFPGASPLLLLTRRLKAGLGFAYVPHGPAPVLLDGDVRDPRRGTELLAGLSGSLKPLLPSATLFLRFDPPWALVEEARPERTVPEEGAPLATTPAGQWLDPERPTLLAPLRRAAADIQPPDTVVLDLGLGKEAVLAGMKPKWRYNIRLAEKKGVEVGFVPASAGKANWGQSLETFYKLYEETSARDKIALHPAAYYRRLFELAEAPARDCPQPDFRVWTARHGGEALASIITVFWRGEATYLYGASSNEKRNLMPTYALQWAAIEAALETGCRRYDFFGIPPTEDPDHPMAGLYRFKTGFGGAILHRPGSWDFALRPALYAGFRGAEGLRSWYYKDFRKRGLSRHQPR